MRASNQFADATTGVVYVHASPAAVCPHVEWALSSTLNARANLKWTPQPAMPGQLRALTNWHGPVGTGARLANALRAWSVLRFEVTEDPSAGVDGQRFCHTPQLGLWSGAMSANGDTVVGEMRLRTMMAAGADTLAAELDSVLGTAWDEALEPYRDGGDGAEVSWLSRGSASLAAMADRTLTSKAKAGIKDVQRQALKPVTASQSALIQMQQVQIRLQYQQMLAAGGPMPSFRDVGFQVFSDSDEDGILLYLLTLLGSGERRLVDVGSAGLGASNTANLIINHGWGGVLFEGDTASVEKTLAEYAARGPLLLPNVVGAWVTAENINELVAKHCPTGVVDLLSIDIDGNDYWIWKALDVVSPRIVVIEYQDIVGPERSVVIPYDPQFSLSNYPENESNNNYVGASLRAMVKLGKSKGYRFVASNVFGFNAFFVREDIAPPLDVLPEIPVEAGLTHPWNEYGLRERWPLVAHLPWVEV